MKTQDSHVDDNGYLRRANEALVQAEKAGDPAMRRAYLEIALEWQRLAKQVMRFHDQQQAASAPAGAAKANHLGRPN